MTTRQSVSGRFVQQKDADDGIAWCREVDGATATLVFTDIPGVAEEIRTVPMAAISPATLPLRSRVWLAAKPFGWIPGEVVGVLARDRYLVRIPGLGELPFDSRLMRLRWRRPLAEPWLAVANGVVEGREYYDARQSLVRNVVQQRAAYQGFTAAASAPILPFQHQLDTLSRVTGDPVMRFVLADEVGLGKTVEAGLVIRQRLLDEPGSRVVVLVPEVLVRQWNAELSDRLGLRRQLSRVMIAPHAEITTPAARKGDVLVIDEAHRMVELARQSPELDRCLTTASARTPGLLLLTATPMHAGAEGFLRLMNLIDPQAYPRDDLDSFSRRLRMRQHQATQIELLQPGVPAKIVSDVLREFAEEYAGDPHLVKMVACASDSLATGGPDRVRQLAKVSNYLRETYRISRRVIRHRRDAASTRGYPVSGRQPQEIEIHDDARPVLDDFLNDWRVQLDQYHGHAGAGLFVDAVIQVLAGPGPALECIRARLGGNGTELVGLGSTELALLQNTAAALELRGTGTRIDRLIAHIEATSRPGRKVLVFTSFTSQVNAVADALRRGGALDRSFALHTADMLPNIRDNEVNRFLYEPDCDILLADDSAAEGRNFQLVDELIHLDLPLSPNAIEQRIGRVDRFNLRARQSGTLTTYLVEPDSPWARGHLHFLRDVAGVFSRSIATLQRPLAELYERVGARLLSHGPEAFAIQADEAAKMLADERVELDLLSEIEDTLIFTDFGDASYDDLLRFEESNEPIKEAFRRIMRTDGGIGIQARCVDAGEKILEFRLADTREGVLGLTPDECEGLRRVLPGWRTFDKVVAATQTAVMPIRIGEQLTDWLADFLRIDERGRAVAVLAGASSQSEAELWFGFDYLVQFDDGALFAPAAATRKRLRRRADAFFGPRIETVWTDGYVEAPEETRARLVGTAGEQQPLRGRQWQSVLSHFPDWTDRTAMAAALARTIVDSRPAVAAAGADALSGATAEAERRIQILRTRGGLDLGGASRRAEIDAEISLMNQVDRGLRQLKVSMLACLAIAVLPDHE